MFLLRSVFRNFPAASRAVVAALSLTSVLFAGIRLFYHHDRPAIFLLGDSGIGNYRLEPGQRLQDMMERMIPGTHVENWAEPGAAPLDFFLQLSRGELVAGTPQTVVIAFDPAKFLDDAGTCRLDEDGVNLRWIPWNREGLALFRSLTPRQRNAALAQQASVPFYAVADVGRALWLRYVLWPRDRARMRIADAERRRQIEVKTMEQARGLEADKLVDERDFANLPRTRDAEFLLRSLRNKGVETRVLLLPFGNPGLIRKICSAGVLAKQDSVDVLMQHWLQNMKVSYLDFNAPAEITHFPDSAWDDLAHPKSPAAFAYISERLSQILAPPGPLAESSHMSAMSSPSRD